MGIRRVCENFKSKYPKTFKTDDFGKNLQNIFPAFENNLSKYVFQNVEESLKTKGKICRRTILRKIGIKFP